VALLRGIQHEGKDHYCGQEEQQETPIHLSRPCFTRACRLRGFRRRHWVRNEAERMCTTRTRRLDGADVKYNECIDRVAFRLTKLLSVGKRK
jgi:hypothetical protein